ncbi:unnamed protein product [Cochlearia groenlandica]
MPIYSENLYSCMQCEFILHEACGNLSRRINHPIHPHPLTLALVDGNGDVAQEETECSVCPRFFATGFIYVCAKKRMWF